MVTGAYSFGHSVPCDPFTVSGRSYTSKYRTVFSPLFLLHPVTPVGSIDVFSDVRPYRNAPPVHVFAFTEPALVIRVALLRAPVIPVDAEQERSHFLVVAKTDLLKHDVVPRAVCVH